MTKQQHQGTENEKSDKKEIQEKKKEFKLKTQKVKKAVSHTLMKFVIVHKISFSKYSF